MDVEMSHKRPHDNIDLSSPGEKKYIKFDGKMDCLLLQIVFSNNPFVARHGTRIEHWKLVARAISQALRGIDDAISWGQCRFDTVKNMPIAIETE